MREIQSKIGSTYGSVAEVFLIDDTFYFSKATRLVGDETAGKNIHYYTLFRYNIKDGSCTAVSDEVGYIHLVDNRFIYIRTNVPLRGSNM